MADYYPIKAKTLSGDWFEFSIADIPCYINENEFILLRRVNSPILRAGLVLRGCDLPGVFEGDVLLHEGIEYTVHYHCGFVCKDADKNNKYLYELKGYEKLGNIVDMENCAYNFPKKIYYKYRDVPIFPRSIKGATADKVIIEGFGVTSHFNEEVRQEARLSYERKKLYFGDLVEGYPLELYYGRPVIKHDGIIYDIIAKQNIIE